MSMFSPLSKHSALLQASEAKGTVLEIYDKANFHMDQKTYAEGAVAVWMASSMLTSRDSVNSDNTMRFLSGMISRDAAKHPSWEPELRRKIAPDCAVTYETPGSSSNFSAWKCVDATDGTIHSCPGAWTFQMAAPNMTELKNVISAVFETAVLNTGGWTAQTSAPVLTRVAQPPGRPSWTEAMTVTLAPRGSMDAAAIAMLGSLKTTFPWLQWDGSLAHASGVFRSSVPLEFAMPTAEAAFKQLQVRDRDMVTKSSVNIAPLVEGKAQNSENLVSLLQIVTVDEMKSLLASFALLLRDHKGANNFSECVAIQQKISALQRVAGMVNAAPERSLSIPIEVWRTLRDATNSTDLYTDAVKQIEAVQSSSPAVVKKNVANTDAQTPAPIFTLAMLQDHVVELKSKLEQSKTANDFGMCLEIHKKIQIMTSGVEKIAAAGVTDMMKITEAEVGCTLADMTSMEGYESNLDKLMAMMEAKAKSVTTETDAAIAAKKEPLVQKLKEIKELMDAAKEKNDFAQCCSLQTEMKEIQSQLDALDTLSVAAVGRMSEAKVAAETSDIDVAVVTEADELRDKLQALKVSMDVAKEKDDFGECCSLQQEMQKIQAEIDEMNAPDGADKKPPAKRRRSAKTVP